MLTVLLTLLAFIAVCVALYYFWRHVLAVVIVFTLLITLAVGGFLAFVYCSDHDCSGPAQVIVGVALVGVLLTAFELWDRKRSRRRWIEEQVREGDRAFREANPGNSSWCLIVDGFQYTWDEQAKKARRQEISEDVRKRIENMQQTGKPVSRLWVHEDGRTFIDYGDVDKDGKTHFT